MAHSMRKVRGKIKGLVALMAFPNEFVIIQLNNKSISISPIKGISIVERNFGKRAKKADVKPVNIQKRPRIFS